MLMSCWGNNVSKYRNVHQLLYELMFAFKAFLPKRCCIFNYYKTSNLRVFVYTLSYVYSVLFV